MATQKNKTNHSYHNINLFTDGGCRGNPGPGAIGIIICSPENIVVRKYSECIGASTNNQAEYRALIRGLEISANYTRNKVVCHCDSQLVVNQVTKVWKIHNDAMRELCLEVNNKKDLFGEVIFQLVSRANQRIKEADKILNDAFEGRGVDFEAR